MKIFMRDGKVNFVDENNVLLGYSMEQDCCEFADWVISEDPNFFKGRNVCEMDDDGAYKLKCGSLLFPFSQEETNETIDMPGWFFDPEQLTLERVDYPSDSGGEDTAVVRARILNPNAEDGICVKYVYLFNCHNGYYSHGFNFRDEEDRI